MKETLPNLNQEPTPPPAPLISKPKNSRSESVAEPLPNDIEGGEAPMDMDTKDDDIPESVGASTNVPSLSININVSFNFSYTKYQYLVFQVAVGTSGIIGPISGGGAGLEMQVQYLRQTMYPRRRLPLIVR